VRRLRAELEKLGTFRTEPFPPADVPADVGTPQQALQSLGYVGETPASAPIEPP
jgi:hypothetical protein